MQIVCSNQAITHPATSVVVSGRKKATRLVILVRTKTYKYKNFVERATGINPL